MPQLTKQERSELTEQAMEFVSKDMQNAFPLIIRKSFSLLNIPKMLNVTDTDQELQKLEEADKFLSTLEEKLTEEVISQVQDILESY